MQTSQHVVKDADLVELTGGYTRPKEQAACLARAGIHHWFGKDGKVITTWSLVTRAGLRNSVDMDEPNFGAM
ncbi:DUF4224 domain-containing protein [Ferrimonas balearica]|uniref:DUF4224 domain-containing protein n=1 Tax=Ferrimonas balearica TaxID=44012 RepID=UPI001C94858B|nr:DUF4224 domain-containing protein [Ferrimonas balearica]